MVEGGDEANHNAYKSYTERYLKWPNVCKNCSVHVWKCLHAHTESPASLKIDFQGTWKKYFFPPAAD